MIEFTEKSYIVGMWFASCPKTNDNWMCAVQRCEDNPNRYVGSYRIRECKGDKIWDSDDKKVWYTFDGLDSQTEEQVIERFNHIQKGVATILPIIDTLLVQGGLEKFLKLAPTKKWLHMKSVPLEDVQ